MNKLEQQHDALRKRREEIVENIFWAGTAMFIAGVASFCVSLYLYGRIDGIKSVSVEDTISTPVVEVNEAVEEIEEIIIEEPIVEMTVEDVTVDEPDILHLYNNEVAYIAKTVYGEARGCSKTEQAAVVWTILNRVDSDLAYMPDDIISVVTQPEQYHGYNPNHPVTDEIVSLVEDVIGRWNDEKNGVENVGRVLPKNYLWFYGDGRHNHFTDAWRGGNKWDWSLESPYGGA